MLYVTRNHLNQVVGFSPYYQSDMTEAIAADHPDVADYIARQQASVTALLEPNE